MKPAISVVRVIAAYGALASACSLNPQPIPPFQSDTSNNADAGSGGRGSFVAGDGGAMASDAAGNSDASVSRDASEASTGQASGTDAASEDASGEADTSSDALSDADASNATDASGDAPIETDGPSDAGWAIGTDE